MRYIFLYLICFYCCCPYLFAYKSTQESMQPITLAHDNNTQTLLQNIEALTTIHTLPINTKANTMQCMLTPQEQKIAKLAYPNTFYEYYNALLETNRIDMDIGKLTQDLLIESIRHHNTLSLLLALQLYFSKQCERCERVRDFSMFDYYRNKQASMHTMLMVEGGNFSTSYTLLGEAFLCRALTNKVGNDFLMAYSNLMMAGLHTRAINALLQGIAYTQDDTLYATLQFLVSFDNVLGKNEASTYLLRNLRVQKQHNFANIMTLPYFQNLQVLEYDVASNYILQTLLLRDMEMGRILSPFDIFADKKTKQEFWDKAQHYTQIIQEGNIYILQHAKPQELQTYLKILELKKRLKAAKYYPFATTYQIESK